MNYFIKSGTLYKREKENLSPALAGIKNRLCGSEKQIYVGEKQFLTFMERTTGEHSRDACPKKYLLKNRNEEILMTGFPKYAEGEDPSVAGWPVYRMPRVDSADLILQNLSAHLKMINSQNYLLSDGSGQGILSVMHRGGMGGWDLDSREEFSPEILCGIFVFCLYLEQENELIVV